MQFRILGPLEVVDDSGPLSVGGPKPRSLLAALVVGRGAVVSNDRLIHSVWGDEAPADALNALRAYVSRLRTALGLQGRLRFRAPGYVLEVADHELDAARFVDLLGAAHGYASGGDHANALNTLDDALGLWRGEALGEFADLDFAVPEIARLDDLRLVAVEERSYALVGLDRVGEAVSELEALVRRYPVRERLAVTLMRALYRAGRQTDALAAYRQLRDRLVDELGVEPSGEAKELHRQVLSHDPALAAFDRTGGMLPRQVTSFVGRDGDLAALGEAISLAPLVTLTGVGGVGKTRLAVETADRVRARFMDGAWLCELAPIAETRLVGHAVAAALGVQQRQGLSMEQTLIQYLRARRLLLVLDNCEHVLPGAAHIVEDIVSRCAGVVVLATSREALGVAGEQMWPVPPLPVEDATSLFVHRARSTRPDFDPQREDEGAVAEICRRLDGLPLAIELAAARMRMMTASEVVRRLDDSVLLVGGPRSAQPRHHSLAAAIDWSYGLLAASEQTLFVRMSVFAAGADIDGVRGVCANPDATDGEVLNLLTGLVDKSMVVAAHGPAGTRYRLLETLRAHGRRRLRESGDEASVARRHCAYFTDLAQRAALGVQGPDEKRWVERVLPDRENLRVAFERASADGDVDAALRLVTSVPELLHLRIGYESMSWTERILNIAPAGHPLYSAAVGAAARGAWNRGDFGAARSLVARVNGCAPARGTARIAYPADVLADVALYEGDITSALRHWEPEVEAARRDGDPIRLVWTLYYVAVCHTVRREPRFGVSAARESVTVADGTGNPTARSMARYALALAGKKVDPDRSLVLFNEARELAAQVQNYWWHGIALMESAATRAVYGDPAVAARELLEVLELWDRLGDWTQQWLNLRYVVRYLVRVGADEQAQELHDYLVAAGKPSPLKRPGPGMGVPSSPAPSGVDAVDLARIALRRSVGRVR